VKTSNCLLTLLSSVAFLALVFVSGASAQNTARHPAAPSRNDDSETPQDAYGVVSPTSLNFGQVLIGLTSPQKRVSLTNTGDSDLTVSSISISGDFALPVNHCGNGVKPGSHCDVYVTFTPHALGTETGTLTFTDNASNSPQTVSLTGEGSNTAPTITKLTASPKSIYAGDPVTLTATVVSLGGGTIPNGEQINFTYLHSSIGYGTLQSGVATITTTAIAYHGQAEQVVHAFYMGDQLFQPSQDKTPISVARYATNTTVSSNVNPSIYDQPIDVTGVVTSQSPYGVGGHMFFQGAPGPCQYVELGVFGGAATEHCTRQPNVGSYDVYVKYDGDPYNQPGGETSFVQVINPTNTEATITSSRNPSKKGQSVKFSVVITAPYARHIDGSVSFTNGSTDLGTVQLDNGRASLNTSSLPLGQDTVTATFNPPNGNYLSSSASLVQVVQ